MPDAGHGRVDVHVLVAHARQRLVQGGEVLAHPGIGPLPHQVHAAGQV